MRKSRWAKNAGQFDGGPFVFLVIGLVVIVIGFIALWRSDEQDNKDAQQALEKRLAAAATAPIITSLTELQHYDGCKIFEHRDGTNVIELDEHKGWSAVNMVCLHLTPEMYKAAKNWSTFDWQTLNAMFGDKTEKK